MIIGTHAVYDRLMLHQRAVNEFVSECAERFGIDKPVVKDGLRLNVNKSAVRDDLSLSLGRQNPQMACGWSFDILCRMPEGNGFIYNQVWRYTTEQSDLQNVKSAIEADLRIIEKIKKVFFDDSINEFFA